MGIWVLTIIRHCRVGRDAQIRKIAASSCVDFYYRNGPYEQSHAHRFSTKETMKDMA